MTYDPRRSVEPKVIYSLIDDGLPDIPLLGRNNIQFAKMPLVEHIHPGTMEISYLRSGQMFWSVGSREYVHRGNEVFVTYPDEWHGTGKKPQGKGLLYWMQLVLPREARPLVGLSTEQAAPLIEALWRLPKRLFRGHRRMGSLFEEIIDLHLESLHHDALHTLAIASRAQTLLLSIVECAFDDEPNRADVAIQRVIEQIHRHPERRHTPAAMARSVRLSLSSFSQKFKEHTGMPPAQFVLRAKVERARQLLEQTEAPVTEIALHLGFSSSQYFATVFRRYTHMSPREVRSAVRR